jgi:RNA polymerase sigma factor (sigma-70 family)
MKPIISEYGKEPDQSEALEELEDSLLVARAQLGDREAFGELVRRHRRSMYGYAQSFTQEPFTAEDIVQDALIRAFLHLGSLVDIKRFLPWLHRIVRNQAYSRLRSGEKKKEVTFTHLSRSHPDNRYPDGDWSNIDAVLRFLSRSFAEVSDAGVNPEERLVRMQLNDMISSAMSGLNNRERQIFEAHFFGQLSPQEIAKLFSMSQTNVYQVISRSRKKVMQQRHRIVIDHYMTDRKDAGAIKTNILPTSDWFYAKGGAGSWTSVGWAIYRMLGYTEQRPTLPMVMGLTGHAFRISIFQDGVNIGGATAYTFSELIPRGLRNLGWTCSYVESMHQTKSLLQSSIPRALSLVHRSIDSGIPALVWDSFIPEFGVAYGYDDESRQLHVLECVQNDKLPYDRLGRSTLEELFVLTLKQREQKELRTMLSDALVMILAHYDGEKLADDRGVCGLHAYETWMEAFRKGHIDPFGNAYNFAVVQDARRLAADFLRELATDWTDGDAADARMRELSGEAAQLYEIIAARLGELTSRFPFPAGGDPNSIESRDVAISVLQQVADTERQAVGLLNQMHALLQ